MGIRSNRGSIFGSIALFSGVVIAGSVIPDVFRFIEGKEYLGHSALIPVLILCVLALTYWIRQFTRFLLK